MGVHRKLLKLCQLVLYQSINGSTQEIIKPMKIYTISRRIHRENDENFFQCIFYVSVEVHFDNDE